MTDPRLIEAEQWMSDYKQGKATLRRERNNKIKRYTITLLFTVITGFTVHTLHSLGPKNDPGLQLLYWASIVGSGAYILSPFLLQNYSSSYELDYSFSPGEPDYIIGPRGGRYTVEQSRDGGTYRRYR